MFTGVFQNGMWMICHHKGLSSRHFANSIVVIIILFVNTSFHQLEYSDEFQYKLLDLDLKI